MEEFSSADAVTNILVTDVIHPLCTNQNLGADQLCLQPTLPIQAVSRVESPQCLWIKLSPLYKGKSNYLATRWT